MPCSPLDVNLDLPDGPSAPLIPGFGNPFALKVPNINPFPSGFPEDLVDLFNKFQFLIPPGALKPGLNPNFSKDIFDAIMKLLDQFFPFLMLYKFFLPLLNLIICIMEVLCSIPYPRKMVRAVRRLFRVCLPQFLNLFPIFAIIIMIISLLLLLLSIIEYIIAQIQKLIAALLANILLIQRAFAEANSSSILAAAKKFGTLLCIIQNVFLILSVFQIVIQIFKDILSVSFAIPPCDDNNGLGDDGCCTPDVCPNIVKQPLTRNTGTFVYYNQIMKQIDFGPGITANVYEELRPESWQFYDGYQSREESFINIVDAYDVTTSPKPVFFPTDANYTSQTPYQQAPYVVDIRFLYNPKDFNRSGISRYVRFKNCIMTKPTTRNLIQSDNSITNVDDGVILLAGGLGYEDDGFTILNGFADDGITTIGIQATIENFIHHVKVVDKFATLAPEDGYIFNKTLVNVEYTFTPHFEVLLSKNLVTLGCEPNLAIDKGVVNASISADITTKFGLLSNLLNIPNTNQNTTGGNNGNTNQNQVFPDIVQAQECLSTSITMLRTNISAEGVSDFQAMTNICLSKLRDDAKSAISSLVGIGFDRYSSSFAVEPEVQFTTRKIKVTVQMNDKSGANLTSNFPIDVANDVGSKIKGDVSFGEISNFVYDGYQYYVGYISSKDSGSGVLKISYDGEYLSTLTLPTNLDELPSSKVKEISYQFISTNEQGIDVDGKPRRDLFDLTKVGIYD